MRKKIALAVYFIFILVFIAGFSYAQAPKQLSWGTTSSASGSYTGMVALAKAINQNQKKVVLNAVETGATIDNMKRTYRGELDLGNCTIDSVARAYFGRGEFKDTPIPHARLLFLYEEMPHTVFVRQDSQVKSLSELSGKKFSAGITGSATASLATRLLEVLEIKPSWYPGTVAGLVEAVKNNRILGFVKSGAPDASVLDISYLTPIRLIPVTKEDLDKANKMYPGEYSAGFVPARAYPGQNEPVPTFSFWVGFYGTKKIPEDEVYAMVKALWEGRESVIKAYPRGNLLNSFPEITAKHSSIPLHPGTIRFIKEFGIKIPDKLIPKD